LYAANLHLGGAVQVATSVIDEIARCEADARAISLLVSSQVDANLRAIGVPLERFRAYEVEDHHGAKALFKDLSHAIGDADAMLVIFGPLYQLRQTIPVIVGFAQPWIIYPDNEIWRELSFLEKCRIRAKYALQSLFFKRADLLAVELEHVKRGLARVGIAEEADVRVIRNCLSAIYRQPERWQAAPVVPASASFKIGFVGRNYAHKNTRIFPQVLQILQREHGLDVSMFVTFSDEEWDACTPEFRKTINNVGPLTVAQCPSFYQQVDAVLFPSLLECFSATPLESMAMKRPLFASDRPFNRDVCGEFAFYFDPLDPKSAADVIAGYLRDSSSFAHTVEGAFRHVMELPGPAVRAKSYLDCLRSTVAMRNV
jgi:glycosyltransferase involved in cell wall biosynthesis